MVAMKFERLVLGTVGVARVGDYTKYFSSIDSFLPSYNLPTGNLTCHRIDQSYAPFANRHVYLCKPGSVL